MTRNLNIAFQKAVLLCACLMPGVLLAAEGAEDSVPNDPFIDAVFDCHGKYAEEYTSIANTASSIADRAVTKCKAVMDTYARNAVSPRLAQTLDPAGIEEQRAILVSGLAEGLRTFTMEMAVLYGASKD